MVREKRLLAPVLDRLLESSRNMDLHQPHQILKQLREGVRRDLEHLFNTRYCCVSPPETHVHLQSSNMNYGLPDLSTVNLSSLESRKRFCRDIERTILEFEPRIRSVKVTTQDKIDVEDPSIRFRVEAVLHVNPASEVIVFDSALNPVTQTVDVSEIL
ncbi:type VI secretion system baseplate subunit TssE [Microbulbifer thermotolerans]|uniref:Type VI secretion system baseplate subunit TssE n=1 Tax=Microbulbifer thermotolerans TaxID=252514 RepID=A0A143HIR9_MICTH|nr:type VI secretion system baseplate subunit TssE [Microbulbifer thermotolerans]AMX01391.1 type VI secretion system lysozyme-related protein [Microbulbifer thermotolerans]MCX2780341.1 type VI secretion system baseplate subunit TssE [Microbulbifer thermotolerans]MCX2782804.1 type VI secretion system baseplate subunit TssE [Microbulbifer thermotolerans]MCX2795559.1 type VI secretion system baseplate subunit TssE [Microbulbifer thermotolerans]MCX2800272.1 type VI secretion system baseplate subun